VRIPVAIESARSSPVVPHERSRLHAVWIALISAAVLIPCFWQSRIQAGDLGSHVYNAWLATQIEQGKLPGLRIATQWHNVLFDVTLTWLLERFGPGAAQRIAVSTAVLIFFWGTFAFVCAVTRRKPWFVLPILAMLAYGFVFGKGLCNFYISLGLCFCWLAIIWNRKSWWVIFSVPILALAWLSHMLPVLWAVSIAVYMFLARRLSGRGRIYLLVAALAGVAGARIVLTYRFQTEWLHLQLFTVTGADQVLVYDKKYLVVLAAVLLLWAALFRRLRRSPSAMSDSVSLLGQIILLNALGFLILPDRARLGQFVGGISFIAERMSLATAILIVALLAMVPPKRWHAAIALITAAVFFAFLFVDDWGANRMEDRLTAIVDQLPPGQRVIFVPAPRPVRVDAYSHLLDRVCIGRCFNYSDYEPSSNDFRVRVNGDNPYVVPSYADSYYMQMGTYVVKPRDLPLYAITQCARRDQNYCLRSLRAGEVVDPYQPKSSND